MKAMVNQKDSRIAFLVLVIDSSAFLLLRTSEYNTTAILLVIAQMASAMVIPVSYTHLDVYKRQSTSKVVPNAGIITTSLDEMLSKGINCLP